MNDRSEADLDYLRNIAESGRKAPLIGGRFLIIWGGLACTACIAHWAIAAGLVGIEPQYVGAIWLVFGIAGVTLQGLASRGLSRKPGGGSIGNRVSGTIWRFVGLGTALYVGGIVISVTALDADPLLFDSILTIAMFGYAIAFSVTASVSGEKWLYGPAWISMAGAGLSPAFYGRPELYLLITAIILFAAVIPGFRMMGKEPRAANE